MNLIERVDASAYAEWIRNSDVLYPLLQVAHILGIAIVVGGLLVANVRLLGAAPRLPFHEFARHLYRWVLLGLVLILVAGVNMAVSFFHVFAVNPVMGIKLALLAVAVAVNVHLYRWTFTAAVPAQAGALQKALAVLSIALLLSLIVMGKLLAYIGGKD